MPEIGPMMVWAAITRNLGTGNNASKSRLGEGVPGARGWAIRKKPSQIEGSEPLEYPCRGKVRGRPDLPPLRRQEYSHTPKLLCVRVRRFPRRGRKQAQPHKSGRIG